MTKKIFVDLKICRRPTKFRGLLFISEGSSSEGSSSGSDGIKGTNGFRGAFFLAELEAPLGAISTMKTVVLKFYNMMNDHTNRLEF